MDKIPSRRRFFRAFLGEAFALGGELTGHRHIPLNKLNTLPIETIKEIEPVLFTDEIWKIEEKTLLQYSQKEKKLVSVRIFNEEENFVVQHFLKNESLDYIANMFSLNFTIDYNTALVKVSNLFFELAKMRVFHPKKVYDI